MTIQRVALVFDDERRPETTGVYAHRALKKLVDVRHFRLSQLADIPKYGFDLYLNIDDGLRYSFPSNLHPSASWIIDTHMDLQWSLAKAREFDFVFAAQRDGAEGLNAGGIERCSWLPLACDPSVHRRHDVPNLYDICFVGSVAQGQRAALVRLIERSFQRSFVGQAYFEEMARIYSAAHLVFNRSIKNDVNMRVFEGLACGSLLITNDLADNGQADFFQDGRHLATYSEPEELLDKSKFYLAHPELRQQIAKAGQKEVVARHTYRHRMQQLLQAIIDKPRRARSAINRADSLSTTPAKAAEMITDASGNISSQCLRQRSAKTIRDRSYFYWDRPEVLQLVPRSARRILEIGCGAGKLGECIKRRQQAEVIGIEIDEAAAELARQRLDHVIVADVEAVALNFDGALFDCVICADVLEHLVEPGRMLRRIRRLLRPAGCLVACVPNARNYTLIAGLLEGNWTYEAAGLLDETHLRFFSQRDFERLLFATGYDVVHTDVVSCPALQTWCDAGRPSTITIGRTAIERLPEKDIEELYAYQFLIVAQPASAVATGVTSIIIVTHNAVAYTKQCVASIIERTAGPYEMIFVDNGSTDGTIQFLRSLKNAKVISNGANRGFPAAVNQGLQVSQGDYVCLLNNDVLVTSGWLRRMLATLSADPSVGLVGPYTNCTAGVQRIVPSYAHPSEAELFAWHWAQSHDRRVRDTANLTGFCLLTSQEVVRRIGALDERFGVGLCEDVDYCRRVRSAGLRTVIAEDTYVHHYGHVTFRSAGINFDALQAKNRKVLDAKCADLPLSAHSLRSTKLENR